ncbi:MAG: ABC-type transport system involved in Fe-S cluster assembly fused permease/ATPase subunit [Polaribacter sp.]|jgi:ABC-type transport system involved in Fe-S cluster assembly fused permease/ATPase subunit
MKHRHHLPDSKEEQAPVDNWKVLKNLLPYLSEFKARVLLALLFLALAKLANIALPFIIKSIVDQLDDSDSNTLMSAELWMLAPVGLVLVYGALRLANVLFGEIRDTLFGRVTERAMRRIGYRVFQHLHKLDLDFHLNRKTGGLSRDIERGVSGINFLMRFLVFNIVPTIFEILIVIGIFFTQYGWKFAAVTIVSILCYVLFSVKMTEWRNRFLREANKADSDSNSQAIDSLLNYETVKYYTNESFEANKYDKNLANWEQARRKNRLSLFALNGGQALIISASMTAMMMLATIGVQNNEMSIGDFVLVNAFMMQLFIPLNFLGFVYREIKMSLINIEQMFKLLAIKPNISDCKDARSLEVVDGTIRFEDVSFAYNDKRKIIKNLSLCINKGETLAVVGKSGSGKSTLVKLLFRFYDPNQGSIKIDQQSIEQVTQDSLRKAIGIVPQDTVLFNTTISENIRYGRPEASDEEVLEAAEMAHLTAFIKELPDGLQTMVGERGLKLSGGEKQRVAIARTILKRPAIYVFDEATSSLDTIAETSILKAINEISSNATSLVIAHRLSTVVNADKIIVLDKGTIIESGSHSQLVDKQGAYYDLWISQQKKQS